MRGPTVDNDVRAYRGIPYAASCAGDGRWHAPSEVAGWDESREANAFGPDPIQPLLPDPHRRSPGISEDCLTVNVWRPARNTDEPLPVMVWFEGGSFMTVSGASARIDGAALARSGVIVVTVNYRVNIFGFLAHPLLTAESEHGASSNYGLMDQIAALRWVRANISAFGGDATRVTVFGVSAGSASIALLLTSPLAAGLFDRAILHSPGALRPLCSLAAAEAAGSVAGEDLATMRAMPFEELLAVIPRIVPKVRGLTTPRILRPIHDGYVVPRQESEAYDAGDFMHVPLMVGSTANEGGWAVADLPIATVAEYRAYMQQNFGDATAEALELYPVRSDAGVKEQLALVFGDTQFTYGARGVARAASRYQPQTFRYLFRAGTAAHADDTPYVFGNLPAGASDDDRRVSKMQMTAWTRFAATGDPNGDGVPPWPAYDAAADAFLQIDARPQVGDHWRNAHLDFIDRYLRSC
ncbi:MAG TPA: carboxylesterase family protein [Candidatus Lustribacter sp.]|nr:carboxylesterase family protein [Candidatus Lustribacter sp.]